MIADKNVKVKEKIIYSLMNLIMHCLLQSIFIKWRWSDMMMMKSDKNEKNESLYSTVKYNLTWLKEKLFTFSLLKIKSEMNLDVNIEMMNHHLRSIMHWQLKMMQDWVYDIIMLFFEAVFAFASTLNESTTCVNHHYTQMMNAMTTSNHLIIMIYYASTIIETCKNKYVY